MSRLKFLVNIERLPSIGKFEENFSKRGKIIDAEKCQKVIEYYFSSFLLHVPLNWGLGRGENIFQISKVWFWIGFYLFIMVEWRILVWSDDDTSVTFHPHLNLWIEDWNFTHFVWNLLKNPGVSFYEIFGRFLKLLKKSRSF